MTSNKLLIQKIIMPIVFLMLTCFILETLVQTKLVPNYIVPAPSNVFLAYLEQPSDFTLAFTQTTIATIKGLSLSLILGIAFAFIFSLFKFLEMAILPFCIFFQTVPVIALAPLFIIWFGFGEPTVIASSCLASFFPILANTLLGLKSYQQSHLNLFKIYKSDRWKILKYLQIPASVPSVLTGLKIAAGLSVIGSIVGEFIGGGGLGGLIDSARTQQKIEVVFAAVILSSIIGFAFIMIITWLEHRFKKYFP